MRNTPDLLKICGVLIIFLLHSYDILSQQTDKDKDKDKDKDTTKVDTNQVIINNQVVLLAGEAITATQLPRYTPLSPEAAAMSRFGEYPVSMFTGIPDITIPLYEIKTKNFSVPITLSYHAGGNKVNDFAPWVGLGWSLNAGGRVTRKCNGKDDQLYTRNVPLASSIDPQNAADHLYLQMVANRTNSDDPEPDVYNYCFPGKSGRFIFDTGHNPIMIPYSGVKVAGQNNPNKLTDESGNVYTFGQIDNPSTDFPNKTETDPISSWLLTEMVDAGTNDNVVFSYQSLGNGMLGIDHVDYVTIDDNVTYGSCGDHKYSSGVSVPTLYAITTNGSELVPLQITFSQGVIKFIPTTTNRLDRASYNFKSIDRIEVYSNEDLVVPMRTIKFYQSYFDNGSTKRLRLDSLRILNKALLVVQRYKFEYNTSVHVPAIDSKSKDFWGYYNGKYNNVLLPRMNVSFIGDNGYSNTTVTIGSLTIDGREPDPNYMQAYILKKIIYPTGGYTTFEYETNKYLDGQNSKYAGGLRIMKIRSYNEDGICSTRTYKYGENESGYGRFNVFLSNSYFSSYPVMHQCRNYYNNCGWIDPMNTKRFRMFVSNPTSDLNPYDGSPVVYASVTEYIGDETTNTGKTIYTYTDDPDLLNTYPANFINNSYKINKSFRRGLLDSKTVYRNVSGNYRKMAYTKNTYFKFPTQNMYLAFNVLQIKNYECDIRESIDYQDYAWCNTPVFLGDNLLTSTAEYYYDMDNENNYVLTLTTYNYNSSLYTQISSKTTTMSTSGLITESFRYPTDFSSTSPYNLMVNKNMIGVQIESQNLKNGNLLTKSFTEHKDINNDGKLLLPNKISLYNKNETVPFDNLNYLAYDSKGNVLELSKDNDLHYAYIWSYNQTEPVIQAENIDYTTLNAAVASIQSNLQTFLTNSVSNLLTVSQKTAWKTFNTTLRNHASLTNARITTYTYRLLFGITSQTDPNGVTTYYEYDDFGRLKLIRDNDGYILKTYEYHYKP